MAKLSIRRNELDKYSKSIPQPFTVHQLTVESMKRSGETDFLMVLKGTSSWATCRVKEKRLFYAGKVKGTGRCKVKSFSYDPKDALIEIPAVSPPINRQEIEHRYNGSAKVEPLREVTVTIPRNVQEMIVIESGVKLQIKRID